MDKSNTDNGVQPPVRASEQSRNSVLGSGLNDDDYADLIDNYVFDININNVIHNLYIDHLDHGDDSKYHHHHRTNDRHNGHLDIIHHKSDEYHFGYDDLNGSHKHYLDNIGGFDNEYGPANHNHSDDGATEHGTT